MNKITPLGMKSPQDFQVLTCNSESLQDHLALGSNFWKKVKRLQFGLGLKLPIQLTSPIQNEKALLRDIIN